MYQLKQANLTDIPLIYSLAEEIWYQHYPDIITHQQIAYMLANFYSVEKLTQLMNDGQIFYLINTSENISIGYLAVTETGENTWFMNKFYIQTKGQNKGAGSEVFKQWEAKTNPKEVALQVNRRNYKSINFYFKNGFVIKEVADFDIGQGYSMDDFIMVKTY
jgi:GNAT superfamily N-acetyltransferase